MKSGLCWTLVVSLALALAGCGGGVGNPDATDEEAIDMTNPDPGPAELPQ